MFYANGDDSLNAEHVMRDGRVFVVVNSARLRDHLIATGCEQLTTRSTAFEPSFELFSRLVHRSNPADDRHLFFYSRPNNLRNLFYLGVQVLDEVFSRGLLDARDWTVHLVGPGTPELEFAGGPRVRYHPKANWAEYSQLIGGIDLGLSLMSTPHTSYPPLDLVAAGAVAVTNTWPGKTDLDVFGGRLITGEPSLPGLLEAMERAVAVLTSEPDRSVPDCLRLPWSVALDGVVARLQEEYPDV